MLKGVDVSHWNGVINFDEFVKSDYSDFMIMKATQGKTFVDETFNRNMQQCVERNILTGMYHFVDETLYKHQVNNFLSRYEYAKDIGAKPVLALDVEEQGVRYIPNSYLQELILCMVEDIYDRTGVYPLIYCSTFFRSQNFFDNVCNKCAGWIARYNLEEPASRKDLVITIHQFSNRASVPGINYNVDVNKAYLTREAWFRLAGAL